MIAAEINKIIDLIHLDQDLTMGRDQIMDHVLTMGHVQVMVQEQIMDLVQINRQIMDPTIQAIVPNHSIRNKLHQ